MGPIVSVSCGTSILLIKCKFANKIRRENCPKNEGRRTIYTTKNEISLKALLRSSLLLQFLGHKQPKNFMLSRRKNFVLDFKFKKNARRSQNSEKKLTSGGYILYSAYIIYSYFVYLY